jgi:hypothetical protein
MLLHLRSPWMDMTMDFIVGLTESCRKHHVKPYNATLVVIDWYTQQAHYIPGHDLLDAIVRAVIIASKLNLRVTGVPRSIMSDYGPQFL